MNSTSDIWGIIPAAGTGQRMGAAIPKQYLTLHGKSILQHSCERLLALPQLQGLVVAVREDDSHWQPIHHTLQQFSSKSVITVSGGNERADSVRNALTWLQKHHQSRRSCHVLVHDAVRPCVQIGDIQQLLETALNAGDNGALLAMPVRDTMKRSTAAQRVSNTVSRKRLWHALTPQCFPLQTLLYALEQAAQRGLIVTDESSAMEQAGFQPFLVHGSENNIKITRPGDLALAEWSLQA